MTDLLTALLALPEPEIKGFERAGLTYYATTVFDEAVFCYAPTDGRLEVDGLAYTEDAECYAQDCMITLRREHHRGWAGAASMDWREPVMTEAELDEWVKARSDGWPRERQ